VFPGAVLLAARGSFVDFHRAYGVADLATGRPVTVDTVYDLASLTKPLATSLVILRLLAEGRLTLQTPLKALLPVFESQPAAGVTVLQLLRHTSGLPAWHPYHETLRHLPSADRAEIFHRHLSRVSPQQLPGTGTLYSDLNFMILGWIAETLGGRRLDRLVQERIYGPLGVEPLFFIPLDAPPPAADYAATEVCPWRGPICGQVHDDNCHVLGGVCGHAGLFGSAAGVHRLLTHLLDAYEGHLQEAVLPSRWVRLFIKVPPDGGRALGFDVPSADPPACGRRFSAHSVGHLGFTGVSFWLDLRTSRMVVLLSNRVHPSRTNEAIKVFRPRIHDALGQAMEGPR
jgi:CubicO group peptidase (beta-lactamase class C family)